MTERKAQERREEQRERLAFLDRRIPELHRAGVNGRSARAQADREWADRPDGA